jgi:hypothetical protein
MNRDEFTRATVEALTASLRETLRLKINDLLAAHSEIPETAVCPIAALCIDLYGEGWTDGTNYTMDLRTLSGK